MIIRRALLRHGRRSPPRIQPIWRRCLATEIDTISSSLDNSLKETHSIESQLDSVLQAEQYGGPTPPPKIDDQTHASKQSHSERVVEDYLILRRQKRDHANIGTVVAPHYEPYKLVHDPPGPQDITLELLLASQAHLGHSTSLWNPMNSRYIYGVRQGIHIISLDVTAAHLRRACAVVSGVAERGGIILFVGTRTGQDRIVVEAATRAGGCHLFQRWTPGTITNGEQILENCEKKAVDEFDREIPGLEDELSEHPVLKPDLVVVLNPMENWVLLNECGLNNIPTVGIIDTDANPTWVTYPIPANDDSLRCAQVICGALGKAGQEGRSKRLTKAREGVITYNRSDLQKWRPDQSQDTESKDGEGYMLKVMREKMAREAVRDDGQDSTRRLRNEEL